ncbi:MAG: hypothetical protein A4E30_00278 [Methanomassiliicoccales archaeon PtaB.Bin215]|nr:MAG: hypothetical protein A4E30_00278 [Methanomassiliicoccales archaeon PtaB.Bin215]
MTKKTTRKVAKPANKGKSAAKPAGKASPPKRGPGQPTLLTHQVSITICANLEEGLTLKDSAILAGVGYSTVQEWQRWGWEGKSPLYSEFSGAIERARAVARKRWIKSLNLEASKNTAPDLSAARYMLAHSDPENYAERQSIDAKIEHKGGPSIVIRHIPADYRRK